MVPLVAVVGGVIVVGGVTERVSLMVLENLGVDERSERPGSTSAGGGRIGNIGAVGEFNAGHGGHSLGGGAGRRLRRGRRSGDVFSRCHFADCCLERSHQKATRAVE